jgi:PKD repeat protein
MRNRSLRRSAILLVVVAAVLVAWVTPAGIPTLPGSEPPVVSGALGGARGTAAVASEPSGAELEVAPAFSPSPGVVDAGLLPPSDPLTVVVGLESPDPSSLSALVAALYTPGSTEFHAFRTPSDLARTFAAPLSAVSTASAYFARFGLSVVPSPDHLLLSVTGPSLRVGEAFGTTFEEYHRADGQSFVSHPTPARLPAVAPWSGVYGLGNATTVAPAIGAPVRFPSALAPSAGCSGITSVLAPCQVWQAYNMTALIDGGENGSGMRVAVVDAYSSGEPQAQLTTDLTNFDLDNGLPQSSVSFVYPDADPVTLNTSANTGWTYEDALDLEWAHAAAPGASIDMTFSPNPGAGLYEAVDWLVAHQAADVISLSWGEPDVGVFNAYNASCSAECNASTDGSYGIFSPLLAFAAAEGISVVAASGDCGASDGTSGLSTNFPASDPDVTGVGGTVLTVDAVGDYLSETAWGGNSSGAVSPGCQNQGGTGGGYSPFPRPWWQAGMVRGSTHRGVPDVALDAATPALVVAGGGTAAVGGTSLATPIWAGIASIADQYSGHRLGLLNPSLYAIAAGTNYTHDFHDIESGNNGYPAVPGWDPVTGLGTPRVASLIVNLVGTIPVASSNLTSFVYATPRFGHAPLTVTFHLNITGGTGTFPLEGVSFGDGNASFAPEGAVTYTFAFPGVYSAQAYVADSSANYSVSPPVAIVVGGGTGLTVVLHASAENPAVGAPVLFSATVGGGVAPYEYNFSFGDGTFLDGSLASTASHVFGAVGSFCASVVVADSASPMNGGASQRVAVGVGGAGVPDCRNDTVPLTMTATPDIGVRDAPADFPDLFNVSGGSGAAGTLPPSVQYSTSDPYLAACGCAIFRSSGSYTVTGYGNDSENEETNATTSVTVAPSLVANFTASRTYGYAPMTVSFHATASGGYGADVTTTVWTFGDGSTMVGASPVHTYTQPGWFEAVGHLSDLGHGNASEAFLVDVLPDTGPSAPALTATIRPAVDVPFGTTVNLSAQMNTANGSPVPSVFRWNLGPDSGAYQSAFNWTLFAPFPGLGNRTLFGSLTATPLSTGIPIRTGFGLGNFSALEPGGFAPRVDALDFSDTGGPEEGAAVLSWWGNATATAPGTFGIVWYVGNGSFIADPHAQFLFDAGEYTVLVIARDSWQDVAYDVHPVEVLGGLSLTASVSATQGTAPLTVTFSANASGGTGTPYRYSWEFGDNGNATTANGSYTFATPGVFEVVLTVFDSGPDGVARAWNVTVLAGPGASGFLVVLVLVAGTGAGIALAVVLGRRRSTGGATIP